MLQILQPILPGAITVLRCLSASMQRMVDLVVPQDELLLDIAFILRKARVHTAFDDDTSFYMLSKAKRRKREQVAGRVGER